jgi:hypothetical protein
MLIYLGEHCIFSRHDRSENTGHSLRVRESHFWLVDLEDLVSVVSIPHFEVDYTGTSRRMSGFRVSSCRFYTISVPGCLAPDILRNVPGVRWIPNKRHTRYRPFRSLL